MCSLYTPAQSGAGYTPLRCFLSILREKRHGGVEKNPYNKDGVFKDIFKVIIRFFRYLKSDIKEILTKSLANNVYKK